RLHTGRTHQIRVHLSHEGMPVLADDAYGRKFNPSKSIGEPTHSVLQGLARQALHAELLAFSHPITQEHISCKAPFPQDLAELDAALKLL
ncbi:MAG: RluA family pseudouridine synthase, partial [Ghiorsea sp.]